MPTKDARFTFRRDGTVEYDGVKIGRVTVEYVRYPGHKNCHSEYAGWGPTEGCMTPFKYERRRDVAQLLLSVYEARQRRWPVERLRETYGASASPAGEKGQQECE
jgi:hypothetical protein